MKTSSRTSRKRIAAPQSSIRVPLKCGRIVLACMLGLTVAAATSAATRLVRVGNPLFDITPGSVVVPAANPGNFEGWFDNIDRVLDDVLHGTHITVANDCWDCPLVPHDGPYDQEFNGGAVAAGYLLTDAFLQDDLVSPATLMLPNVVSPSSGAPLGASFENLNGPILSNDIFPMTMRSTINNRHLFTRTTHALDRNVGPFTDRRGNTYDLDFSDLNYSHFTFHHVNARHPGATPSSSDQASGAYEVVHEIRDNAGNGWDVIRNYTIVDEPTDVLGDVNYNGELDMGDLNIITQNVALMPTDGHEFSADQLRLDMNGDEAVDLSDVHSWVKELKSTWIGDADLDGEFNSGDFVTVFEAGKYETGEVAQWSEGDWNSDSRFDSSDFIAAFQDGGYEMGSRVAVAAVPEPPSCVLLLLGLLGIGRIRR